MGSAPHGIHTVAPPCRHRIAKPKVQGSEWVGEGKQAAPLSKIWTVSGLEVGSAHPVMDGEQWSPLIPCASIIQVVWVETTVGASRKSLMNLPLGATTHPGWSLTAERDALFPFSDPRVTPTAKRRAFRVGVWRGHSSYGWQQGLRGWDGGCGRVSLRYCRGLAAPVWRRNRRCQ